MLHQSVTMAFVRGTSEIHLSANPSTSYLQKMCLCRGFGCAVFFQRLPLLPDLFSPPFDYGQVDGLCRAYHRGSVPTLKGQVFRARRLGPIIEYDHLTSGMQSVALRSSAWFDDTACRSFLEACSTSAVHWRQPNGHCGYVRAKGLDCEQTLNSFKIDAHKAALAGNFGKSASLLVAA